LEVRSRPTLPATPEKGQAKSLLFRIPKKINIACSEPGRKSGQDARAPRGFRHSKTQLISSGLDSGNERRSLEEAGPGSVPRPDQRASQGAAWHAAVLAITPLGRSHCAEPARPACQAAKGYKRPAGSRRLVFPVGAQGRRRLWHGLLSMPCASNATFPEPGVERRFAASGRPPIGHVA
jgi:hypothetical protein